MTTRPVIPGSYYPSRAPGIRTGAQNRIVDRFVYVPDDPMLCGACWGNGVTRQVAGDEVTYTCSCCGAERTLKRKWEASDARTEAGIIAKGSNRKGI